MIFLLLLVHLSISLPNPNSETGPLQCMGGGVGGHSYLPFCLPLMYSRLTPPQGSWVRPEIIFSCKSNLYVHITVTLQRD